MTGHDLTKELCSSMKSNVPLDLRASLYIVRRDWI